MLRDDLGVGRFMSLAVGLRADQHREIAVLLQRHRALFGVVPGRAFDIARNAKAADLAAPPRFLGPPRKAGAIRLGETCAHRALEIADVIVSIGVGVIGHLLGLDEVQGAQFFRRHAERPRANVDQSLEHIGRLRPPRPAIGVDGNRMGVNPPNAGVERVDMVGPGRHRRAEPGDIRPEHREIRAEIAENVDAQSEKPALGIERHLGRGHVVAALRVADEMLGAIGQPADGPPQPLGRLENQRILPIDD